MKVVYDRKKEGIRILRCFGYDGQAELPDTIDGCPVTELGPYLFAETIRRFEPGEVFLAEVSGEAGQEACSLKEGRIGDGSWKEMESLKDGTPVLKGVGLRALSLPSGLEKIGAYACYNCENLEEITFSWMLRDLGAGLFTGCHGIRRLTVSLPSGCQCCLKEMLAELRQTLRVTVLDGQSQVQAKLLFPEYYEEAIENTPARILTQEMHGCGHRYRNAFSGKDFQYLVYDKLFPHIKVQEKPELVTELVLGRLMYPVMLQDERKGIYEEYAAAHGREIVRVAKEGQEINILRFAARAPWCGVGCLEEMLEEARQERDAQFLGFLMDVRHERKASPKGKRRFEL